MISYEDMMEKVSKMKVNGDGFFTYEGKKLRCEDWDLVCNKLKDCSVMAAK